MYIKYTSNITGFIMYITNVSEPIDTGEGMSPIISGSRKLIKAKSFTTAAVEVLLPEILKIHPNAVVVGENLEG